MTGIAGIRFVRTAPSWLIVIGGLLASVLIGLFASALGGRETTGVARWLLLGASGVLDVAFLILALRNTQHALGLVLLVAGTLDVPIGTGTRTNINLALVLTALLTIAWLMKLPVDAARRLADRAELRLTVPRPLGWFLVALFVAWLAGYALWSGRVDVPGNALLVQGTQVAIFLLCLAALVVSANVALTERLLSHWALVTIAVAVLGIIEIIILSFGGKLPGLPLSIASPVLAVGLVLLIGQLLLNPRLGLLVRCAGWSVVLAWAAVTFGTHRLSFVGSWAPVIVGAAVVLWFRSRKLFLAGIGLCILLLLYAPGWLIGLYQQKQQGLSLLRPMIWFDVIRMTFDSPLAVMFGLGPVAYMWNWFNPAFTSLSRPLTGHAYIAIGDPSIYYAPPSHNTYVDIYAQTGLVGLLLFLWILICIVRTSLLLAARLPDGFLRAYVVGVLAGFAGVALVSGVTADWLVPFVYNIGVVGFRESFYSWLLAGSVLGVASGKLSSYPVPHSEPAPLTGGKSFPLLSG